MSLAAAYEALTKGVEAFDFTGPALPCDLLLIGDKSFPVLVSTSGQVLIAASQYGKGRVVAVTHETYLYCPQFSQFLQNAVSWLIPSAGAVVGVQSNVDSLLKTFSDHGMTVQSSGSFSESFQVYCMDAYDDSQKSQLIAFVKEGGGLLIGGQAWHWASTHGTERVCFDFPGNQVVSVSGIYFTSNYGEKRIFPVTREVPTVPLLVRHGIDLSKDVRLLLDSVSDLNIVDAGTPSHLLVHGSLAFPVGLDDSHRSFLAAAYYGQGRVVVATHESQLCSAQLQTFLLNAVSWLDAGRQGNVGIASSLKALHDLLIQNKVSCGISDLIPNLSVYCCDSYSDREAEEIHEFVAEGGGLLIGGQAWYWASQNPGHDAVAEYPGNKVLNTFGIGILGKSIQAATYKAARPEDAAQHYHFRRALFQFLQDNGKENWAATPSPWLRKLGQDCAEFVKLPAEGSAGVSSIHRMLKDLLRNVGIPKVSKEKPIKSNSKEALLIQLATNLYNKYPELSAVTLAIDGNNEGSTAWRSTGLYLYQEQTASLVFPSAVVGVNLQVQIGCHSDDLSEAGVFSRPPLAIRVYQVKSERMIISSLWGGLLYILVPAGAQLGSVPVSIEGAERAPFFKHGETSESTWLKTIRHYPAPWAEFETENIILTVPADSARSVENPDALMALWDRIMEAIAELASIPAHFQRPERIVADSQIIGENLFAGDWFSQHLRLLKRKRRQLERAWSKDPSSTKKLALTNHTKIYAAATAEAKNAFFATRIQSAKERTCWMHAGYPIMCHLESVKELVDLEHIKSVGTWYLIHKLGNNQQDCGWNIRSKTGEGTCNLWSAYVSEKVLGIPIHTAHKALQSDTRDEAVINYLRRGAKLWDWTGWTALETYLQLQEGFGWEPFIQLFSDYQKIPFVKDQPKHRMNLWAEKFSLQVKKNLAPFFQMWGWPITDGTAKKLSFLPEWTENPVKQLV